MDPPLAGQPLRLAIIDADHRVRESLAALVGSGADIDVIGMAGHASDAMDLVEHGAPDVVILDPRLPEVDTGLGLVAVLRRRWPDLGILVMSWTEGLETTCLEQGADCFVRKSGGPNELVEAILAAGVRRAAPNTDAGRPAANTGLRRAAADGGVRRAEADTGVRRARATDMHSRGSTGP